MKKLIILLILASFAISPLFSQNDVTINVKKEVEQYIFDNHLPIVIGEEIIFQSYLSKADRINF